MSSLIIQENGGLNYLHKEIAISLSGCVVPFDIHIVDFSIMLAFVIKRLIHFAVPCLSSSTYAVFFTTCK
jgi:hypothetical protein